MTEALEREYSIEEEIGRGRFGVVYKCIRRSSGETLALKSVSKEALTDATDSQCLLSEPKALTLVGPHPNILLLHDLFEDTSELCMVTEYCSGGDLFSLIASVGPLSEPHARAVFCQVMRGLAHCHRYGVVHRDIKAENVLFDSRGVAKIADFGSADFVDEEGGPIEGVVGTPLYVAPEILEGEDYGDKVDVWSAGVLLYLMIAGYYPFGGAGAAEVFSAVMKGKPRFPTATFYTVSSSAKDLIRKMLCVDPASRLSADQVLGAYM